MILSSLQKEVMGGMNRMSLTVDSIFLDTFNTTPVMIISQSLSYSFNMQVVTTSQVTTTTGPKIKFISPNEYSSQHVNATVNFIVIGDLPSY